MSIDLPVWLLSVLPLAVLHLLWWRYRQPLLHFQLLLDLCLLVVAGPALLRGADLSPVRCLQRTPPFTAWQWAEATELQPTQSDITLQLHPWWAEIRRQLLAGEPPWISERIGAGLPLLANGQSGLLAPIMLPVWLLGPERGTTVMAFWRLELAGLGAFLLLWRGWRLRWSAAAVTGLAYGCGCYQVAWLLSPLSTATAALPWAWWGVHHALRRRSTWWFPLLLGALLGWLLGSGVNPETAAIAIGSSWLAGLVLHPRRWLRLGVVALSTVVVALALSWPTVGYIAGSAKSGYLKELQPNRQPIPLEVRLSAVQQLLIPTVHGNPARGDWRAPYPYAPAATGTGALALALLAAARVRRRFRPLLLAALANLAVAAVLAYRVPPLDWLLVRLPPIDVMTLPRFAALVPWGLAVWAGLAVDGAALGRWYRPAVRMLPALLLLGVLLWAAPWSLGGTSLALALLSVLLAVATVALPVLPWRPWLAGLVALELCLVAWGVNPVADRRDRLPEPPALQQLQALVAQEGGRVLGLGRALPPNTASRYGLSDLHAFDPLRPRQLARFMARLGEPEPVLGGPLLEAPPELCGAWSVRFLITAPGVTVDGWREAWHDSSATIWRNPAWLPEVQLVGSTVMADEDSAWQQLQAGSIDLATAAIVSDCSPRIEAAETALQEVATTATTVTATVACDGPCLLVVARPLAPGWHATVDGTRTPIICTNLAGMGVAVPPGRHRVDISYHPWHWWPIEGVAGA